MSRLKWYNRCIMKKFWFVLLFLLVTSQAVNADDKVMNDPNDPNELSEFLSIKWNAVISILQNKDIDKKAKETQIDKIVSPYFDFPLMSKLALGRKHWPKLTPQQCEKLIQLFTERLKTSYRNKISLYKDEKVLIKPKEQKNNTVYIPMALASKARKVEMLYKFHRVDKGWRIYDVEIQGVSILLTYRSQFNDILKHGTIQDLFSRLEKPPDG